MRDLGDKFDDKHELEGDIEGVGEDGGESNIFFEITSGFGGFHRYVLVEYIGGIVEK